MNQAFFPVGHRATDADDNPLAGGYLLYFAAGTTTPKAVYSDAEATQSLGTRVDLNSSGMPVDGANTPTMIYPGTGAYKVRLYAANDTLIVEQDDLPGKEQEEEESTSGLPVTPVLSKTANYTVVEGDQGKLIKCDSTGGAFEVELPSAAAVGDGFRVGFIFTGTDNTVLLKANGSDLIRGQANYPAMALVGQGECVWLVSDYADWIVDTYSPPYAKASNPFFSVKGLAASPPLSSTPGERWLVASTPAGAWSIYSVHDIVEADGDGGWVRTAPQTGWMAYDLGTDDLLQFKTGSWQVVPSVVDPGETALQTMVIQDQKSSGTNGGSATTNSWTNVTLQTTVENSIDGASLNANVVTLPAGKYRIEADKVFRGTQETRLRWRTNNDTSIILFSNVVMISGDQGSSSSYHRMGGMVSLKSVFEIAQPTDFVLQYYCKRNDGPTSLGDAISIGSTAEVFATVSITRLNSIQGATGSDGAPGSVAFTGGGELTIDTGAIEVTGTYHTVDTEGDASSDDLDTIDGGVQGMMLVIRAADSSRTVVVKDGTDNLALAGDCTLDNEQDTLTLIYDEDLELWLEIARSGNGA